MKTDSDPRVLGRWFYVFFLGCGLSLTPFLFVPAWFQCVAVVVFAISSYLADMSEERGLRRIAAWGIGLVILSNVPSMVCLSCMLIGEVDVGGHLVEITFVLGCFVVWSVILGVAAWRTARRLTSPSFRREIILRSRPLWTKKRRSYFTYAASWLFFCYAIHSAISGRGWRLLVISVLFVAAQYFNWLIQRKRPSPQILNSTFSAANEYTGLDSVKRINTLLSICELQSLECCHAKPPLGAHWKDEFDDEHTPLCDLDSSRLWRMIASWRDDCQPDLQIAMLLAIHRFEVRYDGHPLFLSCILKHPAFKWDEHAELRSVIDGIYQTVKWRIPEYSEERNFEEAELWRDKLDSAYRYFVARTTTRPVEGAVLQVDAAGR